MRVLKRTCRALGRRDGQKLHVVTGDAQIVVDSARYADGWYEVHFIGPAQPPASSETGCRWHKSLVAFRKYLTTGR